MVTQFWESSSWFLFVYAFICKNLATHSWWRFVKTVLRIEKQEYNRLDQYYCNCNCKNWTNYEFDQWFHTSENYLWAHLIDFLCTRIRSFICCVLMSSPKISNNTIIHLLCTKWCRLFFHLRISVFNDYNYNN